MHKAMIAAGALLAMFSTSAHATDRNDKGGNQSQTQGQAQGQIANGGGGGRGGDASSSTDVSQDGDKTDALAVAIAPPSFSYAPGAAVGPETMTVSYAIGFPLIGGGFGEQSADLTPTGIKALAEQLRAAQTDAFVMAATCASSLGAVALESMNIDCDTPPVR